jgi:AraC-like DNA-binding protein
MKIIYLWRFLTEADYHLPFYVASTGWYENQHEIDRMEKGWGDFQWLQCTSGEGLLEIENKTYRVSANQGMLLYPNVPHRYYPVTKPWTLHWMGFNGMSVRNTLHVLQFYKSMVFQVASPEILLNRLQEINQLFEQKPRARLFPLTSYEGSMLIYNLLLDIHRYTFTTEQRSRQQQYEQLAPALAFIETHYSKPISLQNLADQLSVSPNYTCILFQKSFNIRPFDYLNRYRIGKAKELLLEEDRSVKMIALEVGFYSSSYFIKLFKKIEGMTPVRFRRQYRKD